MKKDGCRRWSSEPGDVDNASESGGSSEDYESPSSVMATREEQRLKGAWLVHNQLLRIKEEDLHLGVDYNKVHIRRSHHGGGGGRVFKILTARPVLPCSPLGNRTITGTASV